MICERDPEAARERDARILAEGGGQPRTITRQEIVPPLRKGLLASQDNGAKGTLFPQPWVQSEDGRKLLDAAVGAGWRLVVDGRHSPDASQLYGRKLKTSACMSSRLAIQAMLPPAQTVMGMLRH